MSEKVWVGLNNPKSITFTVFEAGGGKHHVTINGNATGLVGKPKGQVPSGEYGLTEIDADDWNYIKRTYCQFELIRNHLLYAVKTEEAAKSEAKERKDLRHGQEPIDPKATKTAPADRAA